METHTINLYNLLAEAFCYPEPGQLAFLEEGLKILPDSQGKELVASFLTTIGNLTSGEWEELYTRTLDLNPLSAPYVGFQTWGESYQRGSFLANMNRELNNAGVDLQGELPDHLIPVLRYLGQVSHPLPELVEVLAPAIQRMTTGLRKADSANAYLKLLEALQSLCNDLKKEPA